MEVVPRKRRPYSTLEKLEMKKTLVALAAASAVSAFAQSAVSITGYFDRGYTSVSNINSEKNLKTMSSSAGTSALFFKGTEDLGAGSSVGFLLEADFADIGGATQGNNVGTAQRLGFINGENFLSFTKTGLGTFRFGTPNSYTNTNVTGVASPALSSGVGSAYSSTFSIADGMGTGKSDTTGIVVLSDSATSKTHKGIRSIRMPNTLQFSTDVMNGFSGHVSYAPKNDADAGDTTTATYNTSTTSANVAVKAYVNTVEMTEFALRYTNGPVDAMYTSIKYSAGTNFTPVGASISATGIASNLTSTQSMMAATYTLNPSIKLHAGIGNFDSSSGTYQGTSKQFGATYTMGMWDFMAQQVNVDDTSSNNVDRKLTGLGANYNLSKNTRLYYRNENVKFANSIAAFTTDSGSQQKRAAIGLSMKF